jgi:hypothetical protein
VKRLLAFFLLAPLPMAVLLGCSRTKVDPYADEIREREAFAKKTLEAVDAGRALGVTSTTEVQFEEGFGPLTYETDKDGHPSFTNHAFRWMGQYAHARLKTGGARPMKLHIEGWVHHKVIDSQPVFSFYVDGVYVGSTDPIGGEGHYWVDKVIPTWALRRPWVDLVIRANAVGFHWGDAPELKVINVYKFGWTEAN